MSIKTTQLLLSAQNWPRETKYDLMVELFDHITISTFARKLVRAYTTVAIVQLVQALNTELEKQEAK